MRTIQIGMTAAATRGGGVDRYFFSLLRALPAAGVESEGLVVGDPASLHDVLPNVRGFAPVGANLLRRSRGVRAAIGPLLARADLVVSHFAPYALPVLDRVRSKPFVVQFHGPWQLESRVEGGNALSLAVKGLIERAVYARADRFIVLSQAFADILCGQYGVDRDKVRIVPGGVDIARFSVPGTRREARERLGWRTDGPTVVTVRRLVRSKGLEHLIDAAARLRADHPDLQTIVVGSGPLAGELRRRIDERGLGDAVILAGHVAEDRLADVYRAADLFVVPTIALEGFGLVVIEALACGTPALVTNVGGLPEVVRDLEPALVLPALGPEAIADGIAGALSGTLPIPDEAACIAYARRFDWDRIAERIAAVYREVA